MTSSTAPDHTRFLRGDDNVKYASQRGLRFPRDLDRLKYFPVYWAFISMQNSYGKHRHNMRFLIYILLSFFFSFSIKAQKFETISGGKLACWLITNLPDSFEVEIVECLPNPVLCGKFPTASVVIVKRSSGDTIRVLQFCAPPKDVKAGDRVIVHPHDWYDTDNVLLPTDDKVLACNIRITIKAVIKRKNHGTRS